MQQAATPQPQGSSELGARLSDFCKLLQAGQLATCNLFALKIYCYAVWLPLEWPEMEMGKRAKRFMALLQLLPTVNAAANKSIEFISFINCLSNGQQQQQPQQQPQQQQPS